METQTEAKKTLKRIGIAADHGGFELKEFLVGKIRAAGFEVTDFGDAKLKSDDDYPDFIIPLARAIAAGTVDRGVGRRSKRFPKWKPKNELAQTMCLTQLKECR